MFQGIFFKILLSNNINELVKLMCLAFLYLYIKNYCYAYTICSYFFSIALHFGAAIIVISLIRATKYNSSWILLSIALFVMAVRRVIEYFSYMDKAISDNILMLNSWLGG